MLNTPIKRAKNQYNTLRKNPVKFRASQEEYWRAIMSARTPRWGSLVIKTVN